MKALLVILLVAIASPALALNPKEKQTVAEIVILAKEQGRELGKAKSEIKSLQVNLTSAKQKNTKLQNDVAKLRTWGIEKELEAVKGWEKAAYWEAKQKKALKELWIYRSILIAIVTVVIGIVGFKIAKRLALF
jgi:ABC-type lipoprotein release transport system permease subunit